MCDVVWSGVVWCGVDGVSLHRIQSLCLPHYYLTWHGRRHTLLQGADQLIGLLLQQRRACSISWQCLRCLLPKFSPHGVNKLCLQNSMGMCLRRGDMV